MPELARRSRAPSRVVRTGIDVAAVEAPFRVPTASPAVVDAPEIAPVAPAPLPPPMHRELMVTALPARTRRDGVLMLAVGIAIAIGLAALVMAMATGVKPEW